MCGRPAIRESDAPSTEHLCEGRVAYDFFLVGWILQIIVFYVLPDLLHRLSASHLELRARVVREKERQLRRAR